MKNLKKRIVSIMTTAALAATVVFSSISVSAAPPRYGEEWGNTATPVPATAPITQTTTETQTETNLAPVTPTQTIGTYSDVPTTHWAYENIERCKDKHWFSGYPDGTFRPDGEITRAEALKVIVTFMGLPLNEVTNPTYYDVAATAWYAPYVEAGKTLFPNKTALDGQKKFQPDMPVTREDVIYAMVTSLGYDSMTQFADLSVLNMFSDQNSISPDVKPYAAVAVSNSIVSGHADGTIGAQDPLTRAQFATLLYRASFIAPITSHTQKVVSSVTIDPSIMKEITVGESFEITATVNYTDGTSEDYTNNLVPYTDSVEGVVTINKNKVTGVGEGTILINYNDEKAKDQSLVVIVKPNPNVATPEPTAEPTPEPTVNPDVAGIITGKVDKEEIPAQLEKRHTVLALDISGSMYGEKIVSEKNAAKEFCKTILNAGGDDKIALVVYDSHSEVICDFTSDLSQLTDAIDSMDAGGMTDIYDGLRDAETLLDGVTDSEVFAKSIVLLTDGYPCAGPISTTGKYSVNDWSLCYDYANPIYSASQDIIAKGYDIYTIGFFTEESEELEFANTFMSDIQNKGYFKVRELDKLHEIFKQIGNRIVVSGVTVELKDGDKVVDSCETTAGACTFKFTVDEGTYTLVVSAPGYVTQEETVQIVSGETTTIDDISLLLDK